MSERYYWTAKDKLLIVGAVVIALYGGIVLGATIQAGADCPDPPIIECPPLPMSEAESCVRRMLPKSWLDGDLLPYDAETFTRVLQFCQEEHGI